MIATNRAPSNGIDDLVDNWLAYCSAPGLFNPWLERHEGVDDLAGPEGRRRLLKQFLSRPANLILCGEAAGYLGCKFSGIPFTSERLLCEGGVPGVDPQPRLTGRKRPYSEPSATIVWRTLQSLGVEKTTLLWNAVPWHPIGARGEFSNRTPTAQEKALGVEGIVRMKAMFPAAHWVAVGRIAESSLAAEGIDAHRVRHPANGGATKFAQDLAAHLRVLRALR